jgi:MinD-like ATPase involved in chromosome partitioning or flagellar assembly
MALIAIASDKGAPGVTTAALALAAVWPRPVLLAECDPAGGDLVYRFPAAGGGHLDPRRGVLSLAVVARRGMQPQQVWEHAQKLHGGLDVLAGVTNAEQGAGLSLLWGPIGKALASLPQADVIADCGRLGADGPLYDLLAEATTVVLVTKVHVADVIRLRDRAAAFAAAAQSRGRRNFGVGVVVVADHKKFRASLGEVQHVLGQAHAPATVLGGIAHDTKGADLLSGEWGGSLDRSLLFRTARQVAGQLAQGLPPIGNAAPAVPPAQAPPGGRRSTGPQPAAPQFTGPQPAGSRFTGPQPVVATASHGQPPDLAAMPLGAPAVSADPSAAASRTTFSRVPGGRSGRHQAGPARPDGGSSRAQAAGSNGARTGHHAASPVTSQAGAYPGVPAGHPGQPRIARHAQPPARQDGARQNHDGARQDTTHQNGSRSVFTRAPMTPLTPSAAAANAATAGAAATGDQDNPEDAGWGTAPWERPGPSRSGGG